MSSKTTPSLLSIAAFCILALFLYSTTSHQTPSKGTTHSDKTLLASKAVLCRRDINTYLSPHVYNVFINHDYQFTELAAGDLEGADACLEQARQFCGANKLHVARVMFPDTGTTWTLCHCVQSPCEPRLPKQDVCDPEPWSYLLSHLSRLPTSLRKHIYTIMLLPVSRSPLASRFKPSTSSNISHREKQTAALPHGMFTSSPPVVTFFGYPGIGTWIHEFAHSADFHHSSAMFSSSALWKNALEKDGCIPDEYARTNRAETLAQAAIIQTYLASRPSVSRLHPSESPVDTGLSEMAPDGGGEYIDPLIGDYSCMKHQLMALECLAAFCTSAQPLEKCIEPEKHEGDTLVEKPDLIPRHGTWWEMWLATDMLILLIMLAQL